MQSALSVTRVSSPAHPAIHSYYDICPESPDGSRVLLSSFEADQVPGPCRVVLSDLEGGEQRLLGREGDGIGHTARYPMWLDDQRIAYHAAAENEAAGWYLHDLTTGEEKALPGGLRQFHVGTGRGLVLGQGIGANPQGLRREVTIVDTAGDPVASFATADARDAHPDPDSLPDLSTLNFMNAKWAPAGDRFFVVFTDEVFRRRTGQSMAERFKCLVVAKADGSDVRFLGNFTHHPHWSPDGRDAIAMWQTDTGQDLIAYDVDSGERRTLLEQVPGVHGTITLDGRWFIIDEFNSPTDGQGSIVRWHLERQTREELVRFRHSKWQHQDGHHPHPVLSADGERLYFNAMDDGICGVYRLTLPD